MAQPVDVTYYGDDAATPHQAQVEWTAPGRMRVSLPAGTEEWSVHGRGFAWESTAGGLRVMHGEPRHTVIIRDPAAIRTWTEHFKAQKLAPSREGRVPWVLSLAAMIPVGFLLLCAAAYFWLLPFLSERLALALPPETDISLGDAMYTQMATTLDVDEAGSARLQAFGDALRLSPTFPLRLHLVKDDQVNAFAMPGGHIVVYTGILTRMTSSGQLAALLAHEGTHVEMRHSTRGLARSLAGSIFLSLVIGDASDAVGVLASKGDELKGLDYSRDLETEADTIGIRRLRESGVDPHGMIKLLELLDAEAKDLPEGASFLSSHPLTKDRIATAHAYVDALPDMRAQSAELDSLFTLITN